MEFQKEKMSKENVPGFRVLFKVFSTLNSAMFLLCLCFGHAFSNNESIHFSEKVNLALRRTAHHLLIQNGDSLSQIPAVQQSDANTFIIQIDHLFDYDKLPQLLQESLDRHGINRAYDVAITSCNTGEIRLGYNFQDLNKKKGIACVGRKQVPGCYNLRVSFSPEPQKTATASNWWLFPMGSLMAALGFIFWKRGRKVSPQPVEAEILPEIKDDKKYFGNSVLDMSNLLLFSGDNTYTLTYREAKLLNVFVGNTNKILERDLILKSVWGDEGIIVGRSIDVFVSRLRKLLQNDSLIKIAAVHGVGYRMEVTS